MADKAEVGEIAKRNGFSEAAGQAMAEALRSGGGRQAQFSHPELGGMGQWSQGGMLMIGDMFNDELKGRVAGLARDLSEAGVSDGGKSGGPAGESKSHGAANDDRSERGGSGHSGSGNWWPGDLGRPGSSGSQNDVRYAVFPDTHRLAVERDGKVTVHDTGDHRIGGVSQQQGSSSTLRFSSQNGDVDLEQLPKV